MLRDVLRFLWTAFIDHWATWVTGTGVVGLLLWALNYYERIRGTPVKLRTNILILFCTFWFFATFAAWHDADVSVAKLTRDSNTCSGDLKVEQNKTQSLDLLNKTLQGQLSGQQNILAKQQTTLDSQQGTVNSCVIGLANKAIGEPLRISTFIGGAIGENPKLTTIVMLTNRTTTVRGDLECQQPFGVLQFELLPRGTMTNVSVIPTSGKSPDTKFHLHIGTPSWESGVPVVVSTVSESGIGKCTFTPQSSK